MLSRDEQRLERIKEYCEDIRATVFRFGANLDTFQKEPDYQKSVAFSILQIGELVGGLSEAFRTATQAQIPWGKIKNMRNIVVHDYGSINLETVWNTVMDSIPELQIFCEGQLPSDLD